jgi:hypothetical protein
MGKKSGSGIRIRDKQSGSYLLPVLRIRIWDPVPFKALFDPGIREWGKNQNPGSGSGMNNPAHIYYRTSVADPGSGAFLTLGTGMGKKSGSGSGMNNTDHISESLETIF